MLARFVLSDINLYIIYIGSKGKSCLGNSSIFVFLFILLNTRVIENCGMGWRERLLDMLIFIQKRNKSISCLWFINLLYKV